MKRLTPKELAEPDVTLVIPPAKWSGLTQNVRDTLAMYRNTWNGDNLTYIVPAYVFRQLEEEMRHTLG